MNMMYTAYLQIREFANGLCGYTLKDMELITHFTAVVGLLLLALLYVSWRKRNITGAGGRTLPPEAGRAWPFIGHLHQLQAPLPLVRTWGSLADKYGPIFTVRLGTPRAVVVSSWEAVRDCFATNDKIFAARPDLSAGTLQFNSIPLALIFI